MVDCGFTLHRGSQAPGFCGPADLRVIAGSRPGSRVHSRVQSDNGGERPRLWGPHYVAKGGFQVMASSWLRHWAVSAPQSVHPNLQWNSSYAHHPSVVFGKLFPAFPGTCSTCLPIAHRPLPSGAIVPMEERQYPGYGLRYRYRGTAGRALRCLHPHRRWRRVSLRPAVILSAII